VDFRKWRAASSTIYIVFNHGFITWARSYFSTLKEMSFYDYKTGNKESEIDHENKNRGWLA